MIRALIAFAVFAATLFAQAAQPSAAAVSAGAAGISASTVAAAIKVGIPFGGDAVKVTANGFAIGGLGGYVVCTADATASYLDPCKVSVTSGAEAPTLKVALSGYKLAVSNHSLVPTLVNGPNRMLEVHATTNNRAQPGLVIAISATQGAGK